MKTRVLIIIGVVLSVAVIVGGLYVANVIQNIENQKFQEEWRELRASVMSDLGKQKKCEEMGGSWDTDHCLITQETFDSNKLTCEPGPVLEDGICYGNGILLVNEPSPEPERFPLDAEGNTFSDFEDVATERLSWISYPAYLPEGVSFLGIQRQEPGLAYALFGDSKTAGLGDTLQNNYQTGIVAIFFVEGIVSEYELRAMWSSHQTQKWNSVPFTVIVKSGE